jgi:CrcB protein
MRLALIALAGAAGALARYGVSLAVGPPGTGGFPWATFAINVAGSFALGAVLAVAPGRWQPDVAAAVGVGFLGAFTTFSTFSNETVTLLRDGRAAMAALYVAASVGVGLLAAAAGYAGGRALS